MNNIVSRAIKRIFIADNGVMHFIRFDNTSEEVGQIIQESDYSEEDMSSPRFIKNRPIENSDVANYSLRTREGEVFVGSRDTPELEISSTKRDSIAFNVLEFEYGRFYAVGDTVVFNNHIWLCLKSGVYSNNPSIGNGFQLKREYDFAKKVCELEDARLSAMVTVEDDTAQTLFDINSVFDLYFHSRNIDLPNNETPENFVKYASAREGQLVIGVSLDEPTSIVITFSGPKTVSFDLKVFNMVDSPSWFSIKKDNTALHDFRKDSVSTDLNYNGAAMTGDQVISNLVFNLQDTEVLTIEYSSDGGVATALPVIISNMKISYKKGQENENNNIIIGVSNQMENNWH